MRTLCLEVCTSKDECNVQYGIIMVYGINVVYGITAMWPETNEITNQRFQGQFPSVLQHNMQNTDDKP